MATGPTIGFGVAGTSQVYKMDLASYQAFSSLGNPIRSGCIIIDSTTTPHTVLGISDGAGGFTGGLTPDQVTAVQALVSGGGNFILGRNSAVRLNSQALSVMASPPTVASSTTNALASGQFTGLVNGNATPLLGNNVLTLFRNAYYRLRGVGYPGYFYLEADTFTQGSPSAYSSLTGALSFLFTGAAFSISLAGTGQSVFIKVNGAFISLTPTTLASDGGLYFLNVSGLTSGNNRIDILTSGALSIGGVWAGLTDAITPAPRRGPRVVVAGDSFEEGTGNEVNSFWSWLTYAAEYLGWDDVIASAVGGTGLLAGALPKVPWTARAARDFGGVGADVLWIKQSINDSGYTAAQVVAALAATITSANTAAGKSLDVIISSPTVNGGAAKVTQLQRQQNAACKAFAAANNYIYLDSMEMMLDSSITPSSAVLNSAVSANAVSLATTPALTAGATYKFLDGTAFYVFSVSGSTATIDGCINAQASGATLTQCGANYLTGTGKVGATTGKGSADVAVAADGTHPRDFGHRLLGWTEANLLVNAIQRRGLA